MGPLLLLDPRDLLLARTLGLDAAVATDPTREALVAARAVVLGRDDDGVRLRAWRASGVTTPVVAHHPPGGERAPFEPFAVMREATASGLDEALASLAPVEAALAFGTPRGVVDLRRRTLAGPDGDEPLSKLEADLLAYLIRRAGRDVSREELLLQVWGHKKAGATRSVDMAVSRLRRKLEHDAAAPTSLLTARGGGYRLVPAAPVARPAALPPRSDTFVGRADLLEALAPERLVRDRLTVLTGPRGAGKSRLAREIASRTADRWPGGALLVDLSGCADTAAVVLAVSTALVVQPEPHAGPYEVLAAIGRAAAARPATLVVLDDGDGVSGAVVSVAEALADGGRVAVVITSRARLPLQRARHHELTPLDGVAVGDLLRDRAAALGLPVPSATAPMLPLLIELAAGRPGGLLGGGRGGDAVADAVLGFVEGLAPETRRALEELTVFRGGFSRAAATAVVSDRRALEGALTALVGASVVQPLAGGRLQVVGAVREVVAAHADGLGAARLRHAGWAAAFAARTVPSLETFDANDALAALSGEASNLAAALEEALAHAPEYAPGLARALLHLHLAHGSVHDAAEVARRAEAAAAARGGGPWVEALLLRAESVQRFDAVEAGRCYLDAAELAVALGDPRSAARGELGACTVAQWQDGPGLAIAHGARARNLAREARDPLLEAEIESQLAFLEGQTGAVPRADVVVRIEAARRVLLEAGLLRPLFVASVRLAHMAHNAGRDDLAGAVRGQLVPWARHLPSRRLQRVALIELAQRHHLEGDNAGAVLLFDEAVRHADAHGEPTDTTLLHHRALALLELARLDEAEAGFAAARRRAQETHRVPDEAHAVEGLVLVALGRGDLPAAVALAHDGLTVAAPCGDALLTGFLEAHLALAHQLAGATADAASVYARIDVDKVGMLGATVLARRIALALMVGDRAAASGLRERLRTTGVRTLDAVSGATLVDLALGGANEADLAPWGFPPHGYEVRLLARALAQRGQTL